MAQSQSQSEQAPLLFISHKHADSTIADVIREFVYQRTNREVSVYQSSAPDAHSPDLGRILSAQLKEALWQTGVVILVYTTEEQDWQWCMWECGVAMRPDSPDTRIIVLQCSTQAPRVFQDSVRVNARNKSDVLKFVTTFLTDPTFFPNLKRAVAPKLTAEGPEVRQAADDLFTALSKVVLKDDVSERSIQPLLQLQLGMDVVDKLREEAAAGGNELIPVADVTVVSSFDAQAALLFGFTELAAGTKLSGLAMRWMEDEAGRRLDWVRDVEDQVRRAARGDIPTIGWSYLQRTEQSTRYVPVLSRTRRAPALKLQEFDVNLVPFDQLAATRVTARMLPVGDIVCHRIEQMPLSDLKVVELALRFKRERLTRMPFLSNNDRVQLIVHRSMVDRFVAEKAISGNPADLSTISVSDMLAEDPDLRKLFETSFATVSEIARLRDVGELMANNTQVQDVFVTKTGRREDPILGWITNAMLAQYSI